MLTKVFREIQDLHGMVAAHRARRRLRGGYLRSLTLSLTYRCNARCDMCYVWKKNAAEEKKREMSLEQIGRLAASRYLSRLVSLGLTGGETFLYDKLAEVVEIFHRYRPPRYISLATNGFLPERTVKIVGEILARFPTELWVNVSVDAMDEAHDRIRGIPGALDKAKTTLESLAALRSRHDHLGVGILFTLQPTNYEQILPVFHYAREKDVQFSLNPINYGEEYYERDPEVIIKEYGPVLDEIEKQFKQLDRECPDDRFGHAFRSLFRPYVESDKWVIPCFAAVSNAFITPYGDVFPCVPARKSFYLGNIKDQPFDSLWQSDRASEVRRAILTGRCKCLITCETATALQYSPSYRLKRLFSKMKR